MNFRFVLRVTAPAVAVGLILLTACLAGVFFVNRIQANLANILGENLSSLQAAQELEIRVRQLRLHSLLYLMDPTKERLEPIDLDQKRFEDALVVARESANSEFEQACVRIIDSGYAEYKVEQARLRSESMHGRSIAEFAAVADSHPVRLVVEPCQELLRLNREQMEKTATKTRQAASQANVAMLLLGLLGAVGGLVMGYGVARGLRQSIYRLNVQVQDLAQHLDQGATTINLVADGDFDSLDRQMQHVVSRVEEVAVRLQRQQRDLLRAEQLAAVGHLAAGVAHEIRNPLSAVKMLIEAARRTAKPRALEADDLNVIHRELGRVEQTVQGLLDYARLPEPKRESCDLREIVMPVIDLYRVRAETQGVQWDVHEPEVPTVVCADRSQLHTVVVNLILNALDAMPQGGTLGIRWGSSIEGGSWLTIADSGCGIAKNVLDTLFEPFVTTKPTGTGLGLSMAKRIAEEHGGQLQAANLPEGGACLRLELFDLAKGGHA